MSDEARRLLERAVYHSEDCRATVTNIESRCDCAPYEEAEAFLAQPIPAAREAAAIAFIEEIRDGGWIVDITAQEAAKQFLEAQTVSPAAVPLLAQGERLREALPIIVFALGYYDFGDVGITWERCVKAWEERFRPALTEEHGGDCTNDCYSCARCQAEEVVRVSGMLAAALSGESPSHDS